jgi:RNA polymerase sigma-70 factor (ECF subfamily)
MAENAFTQPQAEAESQAGAFPATRWSVVLAATGEVSGEADAALEVICRAYWYPLYAFVRRSGQSPADAQDLTQEFFRRLLAKKWLSAVDKEKGRLRTFLVTALKRYMANEWRRVSAQKRAGAQTHLPIDTDFAESRYAADPRSELGADAVYDREWAMALLDLTVQRLAEESIAANKGAEFATLKGCLVAAHGAIDYGTVAAQLGCSEGAARVAVHRIRKRFREIYREEIAHTSPAGADLEAEVRYLAGALAN